jgi:hypothetical protein
MEESKLLNRLLKGYYLIKVLNHKLKVKPPTIDVENKADLYYNEVIEDLKFEDSQDWLDDKKRIIILGLQGVWNPEKQKELDILLEDVGKLKIQLFKNFNLHETRALIKDKISDTEKMINELHYKKYIYFDHTKESYATVLKNHYIIKNTVYLKNRLFFKTQKTQHFYYLQKISKLITELSIQDVRQITHNHAWKSLWESAKTNVFNKPIKECNVEQRMLITASLMLDNIRQHPQCPSEETLQDSDALDGWVLYQNQEFDKKQKKQAIESNIKDKHAGEVFVMAKTPQEIKEVMQLNDPLTRQQLRKIHEHAGNTEGTTKWQDIPGMKDTIVREKKSEQ